MIYLLLLILIFILFRRFFFGSRKNSIRASSRKKGFGYGDRYSSSGKESAEGVSCGVECVTDRGEHVRSKSERFIANYLASNNIRYEYERPFYYGFAGSKSIHPDFYLSDYKVYIEYWGLMHDDDYRRKMAYKMALYKRYDTKIISLYPDNLKNLDYYFCKRFNACTGLNINTKHYAWRE